MFHAPRLHVLSLLALLLFFAGAPAAVPPVQPARPLPAAWNSEAHPAPANRLAGWVDQQLRRLSLEEKVSQLFTVWASGYFQSTDDPAYRELVALVEDFEAGGIVFGPGAPMAQATLTNDMQQRADLPLLVAQDMEWGPGMRLDHTTTFPRAMAFGATHHPAFAYAAGLATAQEARALGVHQLYAPVADVNNNPGNPIINVRSFGERPELVAAMTAAFVRGVQNGEAIATAKHFPGHGDTAIDSHLALPVLRFGRARLDTLELVPFRAAMDAGVKSIMTGHLALPALEPDSTVPATLSANITGDLLRDGLGYDGLVVTDALNMQGVTDSFGIGEAAVLAIEAGADVLLMSPDPYAARRALLNAVESGRISEARINRSVRRILRAKAWLGLHQDRLVDLEAVPEHVAARAHQVLSETVARRSLTLLRNAHHLLPITPPERPRLLTVTLSDSDEAEVGRVFRRHLARIAYADTLAMRRLPVDADPEAFRNVLREAQHYDVIIVPAFLRVRAWSGRIGLPEAHADFLDALIRTGPPVVLLSFGNPYMAGSLAQQPAAYLAAYGTSAVAQEAAAQALFGRSATPGRLPVTIPDTYLYGAGRTLPQVAPRRGYPEAVGMDSRQLAEVDSLLLDAIAAEAFPGAAVAVGRGQTIVQLEGFGYHTYAQEQPVTPHSLYDLASLTKVIGTTTAAMLLYEAGRLDLQAPVARYLPTFAQNGKGEVTVWHLLTHSAGLAPYMHPDDYDLSSLADVLEAVARQELQYEPGTQSDYSGISFVTLKLIIEEITGQPLATYAEEHIFEPLGMNDTGFRPLTLADTSAFVPTADPERAFQGVVHDPMARAMGGVSGGAGLFSTAQDLALFASMLANEGRIYGRTFLQPETIELFTARAGIDSSTRALGWDTRSLEGYSSAGDLFGPESYGHTGFTGTSIWIDPEQNLYAILLTNRVYPGGGINDRYVSVRPAFADIVYRSIVGPPEPLLPALDRAARAMR